MCFFMTTAFIHNESFDFSTILFLTSFASFYFIKNTPFPSQINNQPTTTKFLSWRILDLSVALAYSMLTVYGKQNRSLSAAAALLRGYHRVCPVSKVERRHLILLMACRLSCSVTLGAYSYQQNPGNTYLLIHSVPAWKALDLIWGTDPSRRATMKMVMNELFDRACCCCGDGDSATETTTTTPIPTIDCSDLAFPDPSIEDPLAAARGKF
jgi:hypothetical protein